MPIDRRRRAWALGLAAAWPIASLAADPPLPDVDLDALSLKAEAPAPAPSPHRMTVEAALGTAWRRDDGRDDLQRLSADWRYQDRLAAGWQATASMRLDAVHPEVVAVDSPVLSWREGYLTWQTIDQAALVEFGRINLREGPAYGYNPTDFFRDHTLRAVTTADPPALRENRLGTVMLRGQLRAAGTSFSAAVAPKLADEPSDRGLSLDLGATNNRNRALLSAGASVSDRLDLRAHLYHAEGEDAAVGASLSALLGEAWVGHLEWSHARETPLIDQATGTSASRVGRNRVAAGVTWTAPFDLSVTAEWHYNGFAVDDDGASALVAAGPAAQAAYFGLAQQLQDIASRQALMLYAVQRNLLMRNLDLTALVKVNAVDDSRLTWIELRYRFDQLDLALQAQHHSGSAGTEFGSLPWRQTLGVLAAYRF
jgi:hypothetical protein